MTNIDRSALRSNLSHQVQAGGGGGAYFTGASMPDPALAEIYPEVADALKAFEAFMPEAAKLSAELKEAFARRTEHKNHEDAVHTNDPNLGLVFSDPEGVRLQNRVREIEKALEVLSVKAKRALLDYLVEAFCRLPEARDTFHQRAKDQDSEVQELAAKLTEALSGPSRVSLTPASPTPRSLPSRPAG